MSLCFSDVFNLQMGKTPARNNPAYWSGTQNWVSISDMNDKYISETREQISDTAISETGIKLVPKGTVIMSFKLSIGKVSITTEDIYTNEAIMAFINKGIYDIDNDYLYHYLKAQDWSVGSNKAVKGSTLNKSVLEKRNISFPSLTEQQKISDKLNLADEAISRCHKIEDALDQLVKSRFVELFGDPVSNPFEWDKVPLSELADIKIGPFGSLLHKDDYIENGHPLVNPSHIKDGKIVTDSKLTISDEKYGEMVAYHLKIGDVVMGRRGEMGRCAVVSEDGLLCGTGSLLIRSKGEITADYIQKIISFPSFKKIIEDMAVGQTMPNLNVPIVSNFKIIKPPIGVQHKYYSFVHEIDKSKLAVKECLEKAEYLKSALMQEYFG